MSYTSISTQQSATALAEDTNPSMASQVSDSNPTLPGRGPQALAAAERALSPLPVEDDRAASRASSTITPQPQARGYFESLVFGLHELDSNPHSLRAHTPVIPPEEDGHSSRASSTISLASQPPGYFQSLNWTPGIDSDSDDEYTL